MRLYIVYIYMAVSVACGWVGLLTRKLLGKATRPIGQRGVLSVSRYAIMVEAAVVTVALVVPVVLVVVMVCHRTIPC